MKGSEDDWLMIRQQEDWCIIFLPVASRYFDWRIQCHLRPMGDRSSRDTNITATVTSEIKFEPPQLRQALKR
jgi:hypothetical protein